MFAIPKDPPASRGSHRKVNRDANKDRHRNNARSDEVPKRTDCSGVNLTGPRGIAQPAAGIQAAVLSEEQGHGNACEDAADDSKRVVAAALGPSFHHG